MQYRNSVKSLVRVASLAFATLSASAAFAQTIGPSTSQPTYIVPVAAGVETVAILTVGDTVNGYKMVGIPDGMGAYDNGNGTFTLLMNHEIGTTAPPNPQPLGVVRAHGQAGAFVSEWNINKTANNLVVNSGKDFANTVQVTTGTNLMLRLCSGDLAAPTAFFNANTGLGSQSRIYLAGEEVGPGGRAFGFVANPGGSQTAFELPSLGKFSWENAVANPFAQDKTVVIGTDDATPGQVYMYVGTKKSTGNEVEKAGLTGGITYGLRVSGFDVGVARLEDRANPYGLTKNGPAGTFTMFGLNNSNPLDSVLGTDLDTLSDAAGVAEFLRPEDGAWDPNSPSDFYFVTTDRFDTIKAGVPGNQIGRSRLWRMRYSDIANPEAGGSLSLLLDGTEGHQMFDNMTVSKDGRILIQEDPGGQDYIAKIWEYTISSGAARVVAEHNTALFGVGAPGFLTRDEESSGIIDASDLLGDDWFLINVQAHTNSGDAETVERGQLLAIRVTAVAVPEPGTVGLLALGAGVMAGMIVRRRK